MIISSYTSLHKKYGKSVKFRSRKESTMPRTTVLSLGGSIIAPDKVDTDFLSAFRAAVAAYLDEDETRVGWKRFGPSTDTNV